MKLPISALLERGRRILRIMSGVPSSLACAVLLFVLMLGVLYARFFEAITKKRGALIQAATEEPPAQVSTASPGIRIDVQVHTTVIPQTPSGQTFLIGVGPTPAAPRAIHSKSRTVPAGCTSEPPSPSNIIPRNLDAVLLAVADAQENDEACCIRDRNHPSAKDIELWQGGAAGEVSSETRHVSSPEAQTLENGQYERVSLGEISSAPRVKSDAADQDAMERSTNGAKEADQLATMSVKNEGAPVSNAHGNQSSKTANRTAPTAAIGTPLKASGSQSHKKARNLGDATPGKSTASNALNPRVNAVSIKQNLSVVSPTGAVAIRTPVTDRRPIGLNPTAVRSPCTFAGERRSVSRRLHPASPKKGSPSPTSVARNDDSTSLQLRTARPCAQIGTCAVSRLVPRYAAHTVASNARKAPALGKASKQARLTSSQKLMTIAST